jgi:hypothetical protein
MGLIETKFGWCAMKYTWSYIQKNPKQVKRLLGISYEELNQH